MGTIAVLGGTGFLGRHVAAALEGAGWGVRVLSRRTGFDALRPSPEPLRGCDAVVNLAGIKREEGAQTFQAVHVELVSKLLEAMGSAGVRRLIHISVVVARPSPELPYHDTKWKGEELVRASGLDWTILRPGVIYGEGDDLLSHLSLMIRMAPVFPIVNDGSAPMMPVHAGDVAKAVLGAIRNPASAGRTYEVVGPERLALRDVVRRVAEAMGLPLWIWPTPVALMKIPVRLMEAWMTQPLSTRAQLAMLVEGLAGDPAAARTELGVDPAPFTPERLRPFLSTIVPRMPIDLRLFSAPRPAPEIRPSAAAGILAAAVVLISLVFSGRVDPWTGMTLAMGVLGAASLFFGAVRRRLAPTLPRIAIGLLAGGILFGLTKLGVLALRATWPAWEAHARALSAWQSGHSTPFLLATLPLIVAAEELLWRGVIARFAMERLGRAGGLLLGALLYAAAHAASLNPLLLAAALGCGLFWGWLFAATDDLTAPIVCHLGWDLLLLFVLPVV